MVADVVFHKFSHEAVDGSPCCREPLKDVCALFVIVESAQNSLQLPDDLLCPVDKVQLFSRCVRHLSVDYPVGVWYLTLGRYGKAPWALELYMENPVKEPEPQRACFAGRTVSHRISLISAAGMEPEWVAALTPTSEAKMVKLCIPLLCLSVCVPVRAQDVNSITQNWNIHGQVTEIVQGDPSFPPNIPVRIA